jgi:hypothetical protein
LLLLAALSTAASAQQRIIYGSDNRVIGRVVTGSEKFLIMYGTYGRFS